MNTSAIRTRRFAAVAVALALVGVAAGAAVAQASQTGDSEEPPRTLLFDRQAFLEDAAKELGVEPAALRSALESAAKKRVDAALAAGRLTPEQADAIRSRIDSGALGGFGGSPHRGKHFRGGHGGKLGHGGGLFAPAADYFGLTRAELRAELRSGKSLADIAKAKGKSVAGLTQALLDGAKAKLDGLERLTAERKQELLDRLESRLDEIVERAGPFGGRHRLGGLPGGVHFAPPEKSA